MAQKSKKIDTNASKWYALMGYNKDNDDETGLLAFDPSEKNPYKIVHDINDAMKFSSKNVESKDGFGTPQQWLNFFNNEPLLANWKFHLIGIKPNRGKKSVWCT